MDPQQGPGASETFPALGLWKFGLDFSPLFLAPMNNPGTPLPVRLLMLQKSFYYTHSDWGCFRGCAISSSLVTPF